MRFLCALLFLTGYFAFEVTEWREEIKKNCSREVRGVDENFHKRPSAEEMPDDETTKCYVKCLYVKMGAISESGEVLKLNEEIKDKVKRFDEFQKALDACNDIVVDECGKIYELQNCTSAFIKNMDH